MYCFLLFLISSTAGTQRRQETPYSKAPKKKEDKKRHRVKISIFNHCFNSDFKDFQGISRWFKKDFDGGSRNHSVKSVQIWSFFTQWRPKNSKYFSASWNVITQYNPLLTHIKTIIKKHLPVLNSSHEMLQIFPENTVNATYTLNKKLE